ncbi:mRNA decay activator protein ZFP36L1 [Halotydeus destructor]|nr:mRNA decay activator protein ZFP36L1 [Halotydeus destructor]
MAFPQFYRFGKECHEFSPFMGMLDQVPFKDGVKEKRPMPLPPRSSVMFHETRYKTELCRQFQELGTCEYGDRCLFAHGLFELKKLPNRHPKFKTEKCSAYHQIGYCAFGPRCSFLHGQEDPVILLENLAKQVPTIPMPENIFDNSELGEVELDGPVDEWVINLKLDKDLFEDSDHRLPTFTKICENRRDFFEFWNHASL